MTEQERPRTEAGRRLYRDTREGMTILQDAMRSRILAIEAEGRQQAVREAHRQLADGPPGWRGTTLASVSVEWVHSMLDTLLDASESPLRAIAGGRCQVYGCFEGSEQFADPGLYLCNEHAERWIERFRVGDASESGRRGTDVRDQDEASRARDVTSRNDT